MTDLEIPDDWFEINLWETANFCGSPAKPAACTANHIQIK